MNLWLALFILVAITSASIVAMLFARRRAPEGSHFNDGDRAARDNDAFENFRDSDGQPLAT